MRGICEKAGIELKALTGFPLGFTPTGEF